jgi:predicted RND superfamily exporter protein
MGFIQRRVLTMVLRVVERPRLSLAIAGLALAVCVGMALVRLRVSTDQDKLFAADVPFFHNYLDFVDKFPENEAIFCVIEPKIDPKTGREIPQSVAQWTGLADAIVHRLSTMGKYVKSAEAKVPLEQLGPQAVLFQPISQRLGTVRRAVPAMGGEAELAPEPGRAHADAAVSGRAQYAAADR